MPLYFIRHGESEANEQNLFAGRQDSPLTELGVRQAHQAGRRVAALGLRFDEVHMSTLERARHTAEIVVSELDGRPGAIVESAELVERDFGVFTARNKSLVKKSIGFAAYSEFFHRSTGRPPGGESWQQMYERIRTYYETVLRPLSESGRTVLVVTHKYVVEMFALVVAEAAPGQYRDMKLPNARPLSETDLVRICRMPAATAAVNDFAEVVEIKLPALVAAAAVLGGLAQSILRMPVPPVVFSVGVTALLGISTFFGMLRLHAGALSGFGGSVRAVLPATVLRFAVGLGLVWSGAGVPVVLLGLFLLLPPALIAPTLSLLWDGDYFTAARQAIAASLILPVPLAAALWLSHRFDRLEPAVFGYTGVLVGAMVLPAVMAQLLRRGNPIRAGQLSTNWNWLGGLALVPLAAFTTFALTPADGRAALAVPGEIGRVLASAVGVVVALVALRLLAIGCLRSRGLGSRIARDVVITQSTPNVFLWFALAEGLLPTATGYVALLAPLVAGAFFVAVFADEVHYVRQHTRRLRAAIARAAVVEASSCGPAAGHKVTAGIP